MKSLPKGFWGLALVTIHHMHQASQETNRMTVLQICVGISDIYLPGPPSWHLQIRYQ